MTRGGSNKDLWKAVGAVCNKQSKLGGAPQVRTAKEITDELIADLEDVLGVGPDGVTSRCETGDPYVTVCWSKDGKHIKPEGQGASLFDTEDQAWAYWCLAFAKYVLHKQGKIHWRTRPELSVVTEITGSDFDTPTEVLDQPLYYVYARVFVEDEAK
jgi:hypothetical protein